MKYYIYKLVDPRDGTVFYVGKGQRNRMYEHRKDALDGEYSRKCQKIRDILSTGNDISYEIDSRFSDESAAYAREKELIEEIGLQNLTNVLPGGGGIRPIRDIVEKFSDIKSTIPALVDVLRKYAHGYTVMLGSLDVSVMALQYISRMIDNHGHEIVSDEFKKYNIEVQ